MVGTWQRLGSTTLASAADTITVDSLTAKKNLMIQAKVITTGGAVSQRLTFNNDTGSNYAQRRSGDGASDSPGTSKSSIDGLNDDLVTDSVGFTTYFIINEAAKEKLVIAEAVSGEAAGAGTAPTRDECVFKWANTSNAITRVDINNNKAGSYAAGSEVTVFGASDGVANDTTPNATIFEETDTGKHYIWNATSDSWTEIS